MNRRLRGTLRGTRIVLGWVILVLGILGLVLPGLQGVLMIAIGLSMVGVQSKPVHRARVWLRCRLRRWRHARGLIGRGSWRLERALARMSLHARRDRLESATEDPAGAA